MVARCGGEVYYAYSDDLAGLMDRANRAAARGHTVYKTQRLEGGMWKTI